MQSNPTPTFEDAADENLWRQLYAYLHPAVEVAQQVQVLHDNHTHDHSVMPDQHIYDNAAQEQNVVYDQRADNNDAQEPNLMLDQAMSDDHGEKQDAVVYPYRPCIVKKSPAPHPLGPTPYPVMAFRGAHPLPGQASGGVQLPNYAQQTGAYPESRADSQATKGSDELADDADIVHEDNPEQIPPETVPGAQQSNSGGVGNATMPAASGTASVGGAVLGDLAIPVPARQAGAQPGVQKNELRTAPSPSVMPPRMELTLMEIRVFGPRWSERMPVQMRAVRNEIKAMTEAQMSAFGRGNIIWSRLEKTITTRRSKMCRMPVANGGLGMVLRLAKQNAATTPAVESRWNTAHWGLHNGAADQDCPAIDMLNGVVNPPFGMHRGPYTECLLHLQANNDHTVMQSNIDQYALQHGFGLSINAGNDNHDLQSSDDWNNFLENNPNAI